MTNAKVIEKNNDLVVIEVDAGYSATFLELPGDFSPESFFKATEVVEIQKQDCHTCPHASSSKFDKIRKGVSEDGKKHDILYGRVIGTNRWEVASFMYEKAEWSDSEAKEHCKNHGGVAFEKAVGKVEEVEEVVEGGFVVKKADQLRHLVYGVALDVNTVDLQGDFEVPLEVEKAAHRYLLNLWAEEKPSMIGAQHDYPIPAAIVVESYIAPVSFYFDGTPHDADHLVEKGSWIIVSLISDDEEFDRVLSGEYSGYSVQGTGQRKPIA